MTPLERKAAFRAAATLQEITMNNAARQLRVSYNHLILVLIGPEGHPDGRRGSAALQERIAHFLGRPTRDVFPTPDTTSGEKTALTVEEPGNRAL